MASSTTDSETVLTDPETCKIYETIKNPNPAEFLQTKENINLILEKLKKLKDESGDGGCSTYKLSDVLEQTDEVFKTVTRTTEARLDAQVLKEVITLGKANIEKTQSSLLIFKPCEYADHLMDYSGKSVTAAEIYDNLDVLKKLSEEMALLYTTTHGLEPLYGALEWQPPEKQLRRVQKKEDIRKTELKVIEKGSGEQSGEENVDEVNRIYNILRRKFQEKNCQPIPLFEFIIDPTCFFTTIQNCFHLSFLIKDGFLQINFDEDKIPCLVPVGKKDKDKVGSGRVSNRQSVISMNVASWNEAIKVMDIKEAMIPRVKPSAAKRTK